MLFLFFIALFKFCHRSFQSAQSLLKVAFFQKIGCGGDGVQMFIPPEYGNAALPEGHSGIGKRVEDEEGNRVPTKTDHSQVVVENCPGKGLIVGIEYVEDVLFLLAESGDIIWVSASYNTAGGVALKKDSDIGNVLDQLVVHGVALIGEEGVQHLNFSRVHIVGDAGTLSGQYIQKTFALELLHAIVDCRLTDTHVVGKSPLCRQLVTGFQLA